LKPANQHHMSPYISFVRFKYFFCRSFLAAFLFGFFFVSCGSSKKGKSATRSWSKIEIVKTNNKSVNKEISKLKKKGAQLDMRTVAYISKYALVSMEEMKKAKIPASITLAQGILESGRGLSMLAFKSNNHFGVKCHKGWKGKTVRHDDDKRQECFRKYKAVSESYKDHSRFLKTRSRYDFLFDLKKDDYKRWAKGLRKAGYATDKKYADRLINLIETYELYNFDKIVLKKKIKKRTSEKKKLYTVRKGDTLYSISKKHKITIAQLKFWNQLDSSAINPSQKLRVK
jgi:flagellum-specific peptidoglycan hydrolase FlgJ